MHNIKIAKTLLKIAKQLEASNSKYELTDETKKFGLMTLYRVKYADGKLGGWIQEEKNLQGNAQVLDDSIVCGGAIVKGNAVVKENSKITEGAVVDGHAVVKNSRIELKAKISKNAQVVDSTISGNARISGIVKNSKIYQGKVLGTVIDSTIICRYNSKALIADIGETVRDQQDQW